MSRLLAGICLSLVLGASAAEAAFLTFFESQGERRWHAFYFVQSGDPIDFHGYCVDLVGAPSGTSLHTNGAPVSCNGSSFGGAEIQVTLPDSFSGAVDITVIYKVWTIDGNGPEITRGRIVGSVAPPPPPPDPNAIVILPTTTRWKPQRDATPIAVSFSGPEDLDLGSVSLGIDLPLGGPATYAPGISGVSRVPGTTNRYVATWTGPWTFDDGTGQPLPLPRGNYRLTITGRRAGSTTTISSAPYDRVSLVEIADISFEGIDGSELEPNPGTGVPGDDVGDRIFAEAREPVSQANRTPIRYNRVKVKVRIEPAISFPENEALMDVYFRVVDVDDPSAEGGLDDEGLAADNRGDGAAGLFSSAEAAAAQDTVAEARVGTVLSQRSAGSDASVFFRVSPRQGDNYRVIASTSRTWIERFRAVQRPPASGLPVAWLEDEASTPLHTSLETVQASQILTVWRTLHIESDRLVSVDPAADQELMDLRGTFTGLDNAKLKDDTGAFVVRTNPQPRASHSRDGDWIGADLRVGFHSADIYDVTGNGRNDILVKLASGQPGLRNGLTEAQVLAGPDKSYVVRDDEISSLSTMAADPALAEEILRKVYIRLLVHGPDDQEGDENIPLVISSSVDPNDGPPDMRNMSQRALQDMPAQGRSTGEFWSIQLVSGFEGDPTEDFDPQKELGLTISGQTKRTTLDLGLTLLGGCNDSSLATGLSCKSKAVVYLETIRDLFAKPTIGFSALPPIEVLVRRVTAHEILHAMSLPHSERLMCASVMMEAGSSGGELSQSQLRKLRESARPVLSDSSRRACQ